MLFVIRLIIGSQINMIRTFLVVSVEPHSDKSMVSIIDRYAIGRINQTNDKSDYKIDWHSVVKKACNALDIVSWACGMAVAILIGL